MEGITAYLQSLILSIPAETLARYLHEGRYTEWPNVCMACGLAYADGCDE
jgi:hypothetical protein